MPGEVASSTRKRPQTPPTNQDPKNDDADYLFGPDREDGSGKPERIAARTDPMVASVARETGQHKSDLEGNDLAYRICSVDVCEMSRRPSSQRRPVSMA